jgi:hypothetical protein
MSTSRILTILLVVAAILASIPAISMQYWHLILVVLGLVAGAMSEDAGQVTQRMVIYLVALALPEIAKSMGAIPEIGDHITRALTHLALGIQGMAVAIFMMALWGRIMPPARPY